MKIRRNVVLLLGVFAVSAMAGVSCADAAHAGKRSFEENCAVCHPEGGNSINPDKPLSKTALAAGGIATENKLVWVMRNPGPGMINFDEKSLPDAEARAIAHYILNTFK
jgi:cytochrome c6